MQQQQVKKKVIVMTAVSVGVITFAFLLPIVVIPAVFNVNKASNCLDYSCANDAFHRCGVYQSNAASSFADTWTSGMRGMVCMLGFDSGSKATANFVSQEYIILNKV